MKDFSLIKQINEDINESEKLDMILESNLSDLFTDEQTQELCETAAGFLSKTAARLKAGKTPSESMNTEDVVALLTALNVLVHPDYFDEKRTANDVFDMGPNAFKKIATFVGDKPKMDKALIREIGSSGSVGNMRKKMEELLTSFHELDDNKKMDFIKQLHSMSLKYERIQRAASKEQPSALAPAMA